MAKVTFYTHAYNTEKYMQKCIESVLNQTFTDFEYIIVDNGSTDKTKDIITEYASKDRRIKAIRYDENRKGFWPELIKEMATGEYFAMLDSDDWYESNFAETLLGFAEKECLDIAVGGSCFHDLAANRVGFRKSDSVAVIEKNTLTKYFPYVYQFFRPVWGKLFKMSVIKNTDFSGYYTAVELGYGADTAFCMETLKLAGRIGIADKVLHNYLIHPQSASYNYNPNRFLSDILLFRKAESYLGQFGKISNENYYFIFAVYLNAIVDTVNVILKTNMGTYEKLCEIEKILKEQLTQQCLMIIKKDSRLMETKKSVLELIIKSGKESFNDEQMLDLAYSILRLLNVNISKYVSRENLELHSESKDFLLSMINLGSDEMLIKAISSLDDAILSDSIWTAIMEIFNKNMLLSWIDNKAFTARYSDIIIEIYNNRYAEAMAKIVETLNVQNEIPFEEELLFLCLNVSAILEDSSIFVYSKKLQTQLYIRENRLGEAAASLKDLLEMCPDDDQVLQLKEWLEEENV